MSMCSYSILYAYSMFQNGFRAARYRKCKFSVADYTAILRMQT